MKPLGGTRGRPTGRRSAKPSLIVALAPILAALGFLAVAGAGIGAAAEEGGYSVPPFIEGDLAYHHHPVLTIYLYEKPAEPSPGGFPTFVGVITPPEDVGIEHIDGKKKFREIHTHNTTGALHTESVRPEKKYRLGDFVELWAQHDAKVRGLFDRVALEGIVYLFDAGYSTRVAASGVLELPLDDGRHITIFLPEEPKEE